MPACYYEPGDDTCVKDGVPMWWSEAAGPGGQAACHRMPERGRRYTAQTWPREDVIAQKRSDDPCNSYTGTYYVF